MKNFVKIFPLKFTLLLHPLKALVQSDSRLGGGKVLLSPPRFKIAGENLRLNFFEIGQKKVLLRDPLNRFVSPIRIRRQKNLSKKVFFRSQKNVVSNFHQLFFGKES